MRSLAYIPFFFATLCAYFALFAVRGLFYRKGREERAKKRKGKQISLVNKSGQ
jgi:hypothetical protein